MGLAGKMYQEDRYFLNGENALTRAPYLPWVCGLMIRFKWLEIGVYSLLDGRIQYIVPAPGCDDPKSSHPLFLSEGRIRWNVGDWFCKCILPKHSTQTGTIRHVGVVWDSYKRDSIPTKTQPISYKVRHYRDTSAVAELVLGLLYEVTGDDEF